MNRLDKFIKYFLGTLVIVLIVFLLGFAVKCSRLESENHDFQIQVYSLNEDIDGLKGQNQMLIDMLKTEHPVALLDNPLLLVCNLAYIDDCNESHYIDLIAGSADDENRYEKAKAVLEKDENARKRAVSVIEKYLDDPNLYAVTPEYYDYLTGHYEPVEGKSTEESNN